MFQINDERVLHTLENLEKNIQRWREESGVNVQRQIMKNRVKGVQITELYWYNGEMNDETLHTHTRSDENPSH